MAKRLLVTESGVVFLDTIGSLPDELINNGIVEIGASPGFASVDGDYTQTATGVIKIELGGLEAGNDYDQLIVGGTVSFLEGSRITITLIDPNPDDDVDEIFIPRTGDAF